MEYRFFDVEHATFARAARHQMLRALKYKIPTEMREANQIASIVAGGHLKHADGSFKNCALASGIHRRRHQHDGCATGPTAIFGADVCCRALSPTRARERDDRAAEPAAGQPRTVDSR